MAASVAGGTQQVLPDAAASVAGYFRWPTYTSGTRTLTAGTSFSRQMAMQRRAEAEQAAARL